MRFLSRLRQSRFPVLALSCLAILLVAGVAIAVVNERAQRVQLTREAEAQANLLASAVSGALAFDDRAAAQDYVDAVQVNPSVVSAAVYDLQGRRIASFARPGEPPPAMLAGRGDADVSAGQLRVTRSVGQGGLRLGSVEIRLLNLPPAERFARYAAFLLVLGLAALVIGVLSVAQGALRRANTALEDRAGALARANTALEHQMAEREKAEEALRQSQKMEALGRLTGGVAHDFNNLLMVASSGVELLERTEDPDRRRALSDGVRQAIQRGAALTRQMLAFARRAPLKTEVMDLRAHMAGLSMLIERSLREDIAVSFDLAPGLWRVEADPGEFDLALLNLAVNARDAMPNGGRLHIAIGNHPGDGERPDQVAVVVEDTGTGMPPEMLSRIFEPFFTTKDVGRGTGLGLSQVYGFARSSEGDVEVRSKEGEGTRFTILLPRSRRTPETLVEPDAPPASRPRREETGTGRILLVEDDDAVAAGVGHMLRDLGYAHVRAPNARVALEQIEEDGSFDLVFSDMIMPGDMDGLALAREIRRRAPSLPVLLSTGYSEAATAATEARFRLLHKPYAIRDLRDALQAAMEDAGPRRNRRGGRSRGGAGR